MADQVAGMITAMLEDHGCPRGSWQDHLRCGALAAVARAMKTSEDQAAITMISDDEDEDNHLACCQEELLRLASAGYADTIQRTLRATASPRSPSTATSARPSSPT